jgi:hypothetical protein
MLQFIVLIAICSFSLRKLRLSCFGEYALRLVLEKVREDSDSEEVFEHSVAVVPAATTVPEPRSFAGFWTEEMNQFSKMKK